MYKLKKEFHEINAMIAFGKAFGASFKTKNSLLEKRSDIIKQIKKLTTALSA